MNQFPSRLKMLISLPLPRLRPLARRDPLGRGSVHADPQIVCGLEEQRLHLVGDAQDDLNSGAWLGGLRALRLLGHRRSSSTGGMPGDQLMAYISGTSRVESARR